ncbi:MAG: tRNA (N(6)-L-threonylcarbamoyladenosine(37)-C(2))-methylthiotransferase MtaB [Clostridia bacterium]
MAYTLQREIETRDASPGGPERGPEGVRRVAFTTLGCKVNFHDTEGVASLFRRRGYQVVDFDETADVYVINTCSVTDQAAKKSRQVIRRAISRNPRAVVVAMGCYVQYAPDEVSAIPGVDVVVGSHRRAELVDMVEEVFRTRRPVRAVEKIFKVREFEELPALDFEGRTRAVVKIQDGCNEFCSFCQIPWARGRSRSRRPERVEELVWRLAEQGFKEVVLTGVHLGDYGDDLDPPVSLARILQRIHEIPGIERIRLSSIYPNEIDDQLFEAVTGLPKICRHLHIPAQSGDDDILLLMRRRHSVDQFRRMVERLRRAQPEMAITTDVIVGFPGETEERFANTYAFCREMEFSKIHVFPYSARSGTAAVRLPGHVDKEEKHRRARRLIALSDELAYAYHRRMVGRRWRVLVERSGEPLLRGLTDTYVRVHFEPGRAPVREGDLVDVEVERAGHDGVYGRVPAGTREGVPPGPGEV